jgi:uncharacterized protein YjbJ (UPF0337 family)
MSINNDQIEGRIEEVKGTVKEATGKLLGDKSLEVKGNIQENLGDIKQNVNDSLK